MNKYRLKNYTWVVIVVLYATIAVLAGCSSAPKQQLAQYCYTNQEIDLQDGNTVSSRTKVRCSDNDVERITIRNLGVAPQCGEYKYLMNIKGHVQERRGYACQKMDGTYEIMPHPSMFN